MKKGLTIILILIVTGNFFSFSQEKKIHQFSGLVYDELTNETIQFVNIIVNNRKGTISDKIGRFSLIVNTNDSIVFSSVGYKKKRMFISDTITSPFINMDIYLKPDTIAIQPVEILPWATYEDFIEAVVELELPNDDLKRAEKNLALIKTQALLNDEPDPKINYKQTMHEQYRNMSNYGILYPTYSIFNPFAWAKFFEAIKNGDFKSKD